MTTILNEAGLSQLNNSEDLVSETYKMDHLLPYFIHIYPKERSEFLKRIPLFQKYFLILQVLLLLFYSLYYLVLSLIL